MPQRRAVHFPPRSLSDLILHYRDVDFHVHKLVLYQHCAYFRAFVLSLQPAPAPAAAASESAAASAPEPAASAASASAARDDTAQQAASSSCASSSPSSSATDPSPPAKRARSSEVSSELISPLSAVSAASPVEAECSHSPAVACLHLPHSIGVIEATTGSLRLFLEHLYFPSAHPFPPYWPRVRVDLRVAEYDAAALPLFPKPRAAAMEQYCKVNTKGSVAMTPGLLSLIHYFDAERLWQQCVAVIKADGATPCNAWLWLSCDLSRFGLKAEEDWLIQQAAKDTAVHDSEMYCSCVHRLTPSLWLRVLQAIHQSKEIQRE